MYEIFDRFLLFLCSTTLYLFLTNNSFFIVPVIIAIVLSSLFLYYEDIRIKLAGTIAFIVLCFLSPNYIIFLPLLLYDILLTKYQFGLILLPLLFLYQNENYSAYTLSITLVLFIFTYVLKYKTDRLNVLKSEYNELRDRSVGLSLQLEEKNQSLLRNQDYEINLATLNERNRISKEIHDNIGHVLSRALLQVGALLTITQDEFMKEGLSDLKESLSGGMDQIRNSIHHMYDESIDLYMQIECIVKEFTFCPISYEYDIKSPPSIQMKHSMIAITKESLANIIRHSNATKVVIILREHPAMYQLVIQDNGTLETSLRNKLIKALNQQDFGESMGLRNIYDRVKSFHGNMNVTLDHGFKLFLSIPKQNP
jgi:signal transduction histidine kinase